MWLTTNTVFQQWQKEIIFFILDFAIFHKTYHTKTCFSPLYKTSSSSQKIADRPSFYSAKRDILFHSVLATVSFTTSHFQSSCNLCWLLSLKWKVVFYFRTFPPFWLWTMSKLMNFGIKTFSSSQACHNSQVKATHRTLLRLAGVRETGTSLSCFESF